MIVIEGRQGKSIILAKYIDELVRKVNPDHISIIDYVGISHMFNENVNCYSFGKDALLEDFVEDLLESGEYFQNTEYLILSLNAPKKVLEELKAVEHKFNKQVVITIQNDNLDEINVFEY